MPYAAPLYRVTGVLFFVAGFVAMLLAVFAQPELAHFFGMPITFTTFSGTPVYQGLAIIPYGIVLALFGLVTFVRQRGSLLMTFACLLTWVWLTALYPAQPLSALLLNLHLPAGKAMLFSIYLVPAALIFEGTNHENWTRERLI